MNPDQIKSPQINLEKDSKEEIPNTPQTEIPKAVPQKIPLQDIAYNPTQNQPKNLYENDPQIKQVATKIAGNPISTDENHPLHVLDNQVDPLEKAKKIIPGQKPIRTYESDLAEALARQKTSVMTMAIAENQRKTGEKSIANKTPSQAPKKAFILVLSLIFIVAGGGAGYFLYLKSPLAVKPVVTKVENRIPSVINTDEQRVVNAPSLQKNNLLKTIINEFNRENSAGKISEIVLSKKTETGSVKVTAGEFIDSMDFGMTDTLKRSLTDRWMLGTFSKESNGVVENIPFIIFTTDFFQNAFAGMLRWENTMPEELADILGYREKANPIDETASSTASTTTTTTTRISSLFNIKGVFEDKIISNRDIREFKNSMDDPLFMYSFIDKNTLLISTSKEVIPAILERIEKQTYIR